MKLDLRSTRAKLQLLYMASFIFLVILLLIQQYKNKQTLHEEDLIDTTKLVCVSEVCLDDECIEVPGRPKVGKLLIKKSFDNPNVIQVVVQLYRNKNCADTGN